MNDPLEKPASSAFELADFEREVPVENLPPVKWSIQKHEVAQLLALSGLKKTEISKATKVPLNTINNWLTSTEFREYIDRLALEMAGVLKSKRLQILTKILDARIRAIEDEDNGDWAKMSRKDTLDILKEIREETEEGEKKQESAYIQLMEKLIDKATPVITISPGS